MTLAVWGCIAQVFSRTPLDLGLFDVFLTVHSCGFGSGEDQQVLSRVMWSTGLNTVSGELDHRAVRLLSCEVTLSLLSLLSPLEQSRSTGPLEGRAARLHLLEARGSMEVIWHFYIGNICPCSLIQY